MKKGALNNVVKIFEWSYTLHFSDMIGDNARTSSNYIHKLDLIFSWLYYIKVQTNRILFIFYDRIVCACMSLLNLYREGCIS